MCWIFVAKYHFMCQAKNSSIKWLSREYILPCSINVTWQERKDREQSCPHLYEWVELILTGSGLCRCPGSQLRDGDLNAGWRFIEEWSREQRLKREGSRTERKVSRTVMQLLRGFGWSPGSSSPSRSPQIEARG